MVYKYYDDYRSLDGIEEYKQKMISRGDGAELVSFALNVMKSRWPEAEPIIMNSLYGARYEYALFKGKRKAKDSWFYKDFLSTFNDAFDDVREAYDEYDIPEHSLTPVLQGNTITFYGSDIYMGKLIKDGDELTFHDRFGDESDSIDYTEDEDEFYDWIRDIIESILT